jgi:hypothetical protein
MKTDQYITCLQRADVGDILEVYMLNPTAILRSRKINMEELYTQKFPVVAKINILDNVGWPLHKASIIIGSKQSTVPFWFSSKKTIIAQYSKCGLITFASNFDYYKSFYFPWPSDIVVKKIIKSNEV